MKFYMMDLCGVYMIAYRDLPHTIAYTNDESETLNLLDSVYSLIIGRLKRLSVDRTGDFPAIWIIIDGFESLYFSYKKRAESIIALILSKGKIANVHLVLFSSYTKSAGGIDELFPSHGIFNGVEIATAKLHRITRSKITTAPNEVIYKNADGICTKVRIPTISENTIRERVNWWKNQCK